VSKDSNSERRRVPKIGLSTILIVVLALGTFAIWYSVYTRPVGGAIPAAGPGLLASSTISSAPVATPSPTPPPDPTLAWTRYTDSANQLSLRYQPTWLQRTCKGESRVSLYLAPVQAALGACSSGFGGQMYVAVSSGDQRSTYLLDNDYADLVSQPVTVGGVNGQRQSATVGNSAEAAGPPAGTRIVQYLFYTHSRTYLCYYGQAPSGATSTNVASDFDLMVMNTLAFTS
jgi:hypothetical protein